MVMTEEQNEHIDDNVAREVPFDDASPEPDTEAGGRFLVALGVLTASLLIAWGLLAGLYKASIAENRPVEQDFRLRQVVEQNQSYLNDYRTYNPEDDEVTIYQVPVEKAEEILLNNPEYLAHMPGTTPAASVPGANIELPPVPTRDEVLGEATTDDDAAANDGESASDDTADEAVNSETDNNASADDSSTETGASE
jgi:hypothetical protein